MIGVVPFEFNLLLCIRDDDIRLEGDNFCDFIEWAVELQLEEQC